MLTRQKYGWNLPHFTSLTRHHSTPYRPLADVLPCRFQLDSRQIKRAEIILDCQLWCWGCDIRRAEGNLLLQYGLDKHSAPVPNQQSAYRYQIGHSTTLTLWGWGIWIADAQEGCVFVRRSNFNVGYTSKVQMQPQVWRIQDIPTTLTPTSPAEQQSTRYLLSQLVAWIADYEIWISSITASSYRQICTTAWPPYRHHHKTIQVGTLAFLWKDLSENLWVS